MKRRRGKSNGLLPPELARKISPWILNTAQMGGAVGRWALIGAMVLCVYGPEHDGFLYLIGPWLFIYLFTLLWSIRLEKQPVMILRGKRSGKHPIAENDPAVERLAALYKSGEARRRIWRQALQLSVIVFLAVWAATFLTRDSINWVYPSPANHFLMEARRPEPGYYLGAGLLGTFPVALLLVLGGFHHWCLTTWVEREANINEPGG